MFLPDWSILLQIIRLAEETVKVFKRTVLDSHGSKSKIGNLIVGWNEDSQTIAVVPTVPDLSGCSDPSFYRRPEILKAYRSKYPSDAFVIYPDKKGYIGINAYDWLDDESLYVYVSQEDELAAFTDFFMKRFATK